MRTTNIQKGICRVIPLLIMLIFIFPGIYAEMSSDSDALQGSITESANPDYQVYEGSLFRVEFPKSATVTESESQIKFSGDNPPFSMTVGLSPRKTSYASLDEFINQWTSSFSRIYTIDSTDDVFVGDIPAKQFVIKNKDGEVIMISTIFWENNTPQIISTGGGSETLTEEEKHFLETYKNTDTSSGSTLDTVLTGKKTYTDPKYSFEYPEDWSVSKDDKGQIFFDVPNRNVFITGNYTKSSLDFPQYIKSIEENLKSLEYGDFKVIKEINGESKEGYPTAIIDNTFMFKGRLTHMRLYILSAHNTYYFHYIIYWPEESNDIRELTDEMFNSYTIAP